MRSELKKAFQVDSKNFTNYFMKEIINERVLGTTLRGNSNGKNIPLIKMGDIGRGEINLIGNEQIKYNSDLDLLLLQRGDILFNTRNTPDLVGKSAIFLASGEYTFDNNLMRLRLTENVCPFFLNYLLNSPEIIRELFSISSGTTSVAAIYWNDLKKLKINLPPLPEQRKIAEILSGIDKLISNIKGEIIKLKFLEKSIINNLLQYGIESTDYKENKLFKIPINWQIVNLQEISTRIGDGLHSTPIYSDKSEYYFVNGNNFVNGKIQINEKTRTVSHQEYLKHIIDLNKQSLLMSINGTIGNIAIYDCEKIILGKSACYINLSKQVSRDFIFYQLSSNRIKKHFINELTGTTIKNLSLKTIRSTPILLPPLDEQNKIAESISIISKRIKLKDELLNKYQKLRNSLSQDLLSGRKRVKI